MTSRALASRLITGAALLFLSGCAGACPETGGTPTPSVGNVPSFQAIQTQIFNQSCVTGGCHNLAGANNLTLVEGLAYRQIVGVTPTNDAARQAGLLRVTPGNPGKSLLFIKISQDPPPAGMGSHMPLSGPSLSPTQIEMVRQWIAAGALESGGATPASALAPIPPTATASPSTKPTAESANTPGNLLSGTPPASPTPTASPSPAPIPTATATAPFNADATLASIQATIFTPICATPFCHGAAAQSGNLVLEAGMAHDQLVGVLPSNPAARAAGLLRVSPGSPDESFIVIKLQGPAPDEGVQMPNGLPPLPIEQIQLIRDWIAQGALP